MRILDKLVAGIYFGQLNSNKVDRSDFLLGIARFVLVVPFGLILVFLQIILSEKIDPDIANTLPTTKLASLTILLILTGVSYWITSGNKELFMLIKSTSDTRLKEYSKYYKYLIFSCIAIYILLLIVK